jgi:hypothetical protein
MWAGGCLETREYRNARSEAKPKQYAEGALSRNACTHALACANRCASDPPATKYTTADFTLNGSEVSTKLTLTVDRSKPAPRPRPPFAPSLAPRFDGGLEVAPVAVAPGPDAPVGPGVEPTVFRSVDFELDPPHDPSTSASRATTSVDRRVTESTRRRRYRGPPRGAQVGLVVIAQIDTR